MSGGGRRGERGEPPLGSLRQGGGFASGNHTFGPRSLLENIPLDAMRKKEVAMLNEF